MYFMNYYNSMVESILHKDNFTLEELLDDDEIIGECKVLNTRLINFLREREQVEQLLRYIVEEPPEDADSKVAFKFPFIACEILTCEIDVILKTLVEDEELMNLLFSFLEPNRPHSTVFAGYFSKVVVCLMLHKTVPLMNYVQAHQVVFCQLVDLIGITSIMEVLLRLVGADDHVFPNFPDVMQWLADSNLLEMIVDKLRPSSPPEVQANAAETLCVVTRNAPSALATKLSSPSFVARIFSHALEDSESKSSLVHSLSVCISLLDPKRSATFSPLLHSFHGQHIYEPPIPVNEETISAMLPKLGDLLGLLNVASDEKILPMTYGELKPPLGKHRLKIVEFIAVLLQTGNEATEEELVSSGTIRRILDLFFEYPFNNALHHHVENIVLSCLETKRDLMLTHLLWECDLIGKILLTEKQPILSGDLNQPTLPALGKKPPRLGNIGHITRISNKLLQLGNNNSLIQSYMQENSDWNEWQASILQERNVIENVCLWACGRPTTLQDKTRDSDDDDIHDRDYDVAALANNITQAFRYYPKEETEEDHGGLDRDDGDIYFDNESAEVVMSSLRLDDQGSLFTNSNWFTFRDVRISDAHVSTSTTEMMDDIYLNGTGMGGNNSSDDDEVVVGEEDHMDESKYSVNGMSSSHENSHKGFPATAPISQSEKANGKVLQVGGSSLKPFEDLDVNAVNHLTEEATNPDATPNLSGESTSANRLSPTKDSSDGPASSDERKKSATMPSLFEDDVEFVGVELEGTEKAMEQALKEGIVGEAGPLKRNIIPKVPEMGNPDDGSGGMKEFNDANYWRVDQEVTVLE